MQTNVAEFVLSAFQVVTETTGLFAGCKTSSLERCMTPFLMYLAKKKKKKASFPVLARLSEFSTGKATVQRASVGPPKKELQFHGEDFSEL